MRVTALILLSAFAAYSQATAPAVPDEKLRTELERSQKILKDWANLGRYRGDNASVSAPASGEKRVVFMGDSITDAWGRSYGKFFPGKPYINRGISGQTTPQMLVRFRPDVIALKPKAVVILAGTNDIAGNTGPMTLEEIEGNLDVDGGVGKSQSIKVVLASVMPVTDAIGRRRSAARRKRSGPERMDQGIRRQRQTRSTSITTPRWSMTRECSKPS